MYDWLRRRTFEEHKSIAHIVRDIIAEARRRAEEPGCKRGEWRAFGKTPIEGG